MKPLGAIFDVDGTLVDSMAMWADSTEWVFRHYGAQMPEGFFERVEPITVMDMCVIDHDEFGFGASAEEVYEAVCAHVRDCYAHEIQMFPGARDFLAELNAAGIPMVVASSTPVREFTVGLEAHGLRGFFRDVVSTEDVGGRDKEFPDVYLEACRRLGLDADDPEQRAGVWVFEDAPFGVQTSHKAGFRVVGLMNDHDGRREEDVRPYCDIYAHGFAELSLALLEDYERTPERLACAEPLRALIVDGSPEASSPELVRALAAEADYVVAVDRGAESLLSAGVEPDVFAGDADSVAHEAARRSRPLSVTLTCASGGRPDHALAVIGLLADAPAVGARMVEDGFELRVLRPEGEGAWELGADALGHTFSAVAVAPGTRVDLEGMQWPLSDKPMGLLADLGISNVATSADARAVCRAGALAAFLIK